MKKSLIFLLSFFAAYAFGACENNGRESDFPQSSSSQSSSSQYSSSSEEEDDYNHGSWWGSGGYDGSSEPSDWNSSIGGSEDSSESSEESSSDSSEDSTESSGESSSDSLEESEEDSSSNEDSSSEEDSAEGEEETHLYTDFTAEEKGIFTQYIGAVIPFIPNDSYILDGYYGGDEYEYGINFYTFGNTQEEFEAYLAVYDTEYTFIESYQDEYGDTWYWYEKGDVVVDLSYYQIDENDFVVDVYVYSDLSIDLEEGDGSEDSSESEEDSSSNEDSSSEEDSAEGEEETHLYTDFTAEEKEIFTQYIGAVIPFIPNDSYILDGYYGGDEYEYGINFYTFGNTQEEFEAYLAVYDTEYTFIESYQDEEGDTWYWYEKGDVVVDLVYYQTDENDFVVDVYVYSDLSIDLEEGDGSEDSSESEEVTGLITNDGKGLPTAESGVYDVDFTKATYVKNVIEQKMYVDGCPTIGSPAVLVIPVEFSDVTAQSKGYDTETIDKAFNGGVGDTDYFSVHDYYYQSSYAQLDLDITVLDTWFRPQYNSSYYLDATSTFYGQPFPCGDQMIMDEALDWLDQRGEDLSRFDSDGNGIIDAIVLINTLDVSADVDMQWAYRYWNYYVDSDNNYYEYDDVRANDYIWASYQFLHESNGGYDDDTAVNTYTYIHEFGHILGADDYYDTSYTNVGDNSPMGYYDVMDAMAGDHNAYTKFNYGWLTSSRLVVAEESVTVDLEAFGENGDTIIIANNWDDDLGAYQEYFVVVYYTNGGLNANGGGYFEEEGILVYRVNASLISDNEGYNVYNNNTDASNEYGTENNLIEYVRNGNAYVYGVGDSLQSTLTDDSGNKIAYIFTVDSLDGNKATLTFTKNN